VYRVGLVGTGGVGRKRAAVVAEHDDCALVSVCDVDAESARSLAVEAGASVAGTWAELVSDPELDLVVVATTHDALAEISAAALRAGKHVLCEKPVGRNPAEVRQVVAAAGQSGACLRAGYNHRFHPAVARVREVAASGQLGPLHFIRGRYGHGGRPGYDREWRGIAERAGGGEMLDQGAHLVDLSRWMLGEFATVTGCAETLFWDVAPLEDTAFGLFRTSRGQVASLHVSWTQWKNLFCFEVFGRDGYAIAEGLGGSYGTERAVIGRRRPEGGAPEEERTEYPGEDASWRLEWEAFLAAIEGRAADGANGAEALATMEWIYRLYRASSEGRWVSAGEPP